MKKLEELAILDKGLRLGTGAIAAELAESDRIVRSRSASGRIHDAAVKARLQGLKDADFRRHARFAERVALQQQRLRLPEFPTTTIGSFPQTPEIRQARAGFRRGEIGPEAYRDAMRGAIREAVRVQEELGLDLLVHGEAERNDMVEYFGEQLEGLGL